MAIPIKSPRDIEQMRRAGALLWRILDEAITQATPGTRTRDLDALIAARIAEGGAEAVAREAGFPGASSITVNEEVVHARPGPRLLRDGDVVTIDAALRLDGWCVDAAQAFVVGDACSPESAILVTAAAEAMGSVIRAMEPGQSWLVASAPAARVAREADCVIAREYAGHGIGRNLHEPPAAPFTTDPKHDFRLRPGMVLTVEPVLNQGKGALLTLDDGRTVVTADRSRAAHEERTIAITRRGALDLTAP